LLKQQVSQLRFRQGWRLKTFYGKFHQLLLIQ
jgi:hypothetical protein